MDITEQMVDFYNGAHLLEKLAAWAYVVTNPQMVHDHLTSFEAAYDHLVKMHAAGKLGAGVADFSEENLERIKRITHLLRSGLDSSDARDAAQEIHDLAERCLQGLKQTKPPSSGCE